MALTIGVELSNSKLDIYIEQNAKTSSNVISIDPMSSVRANIGSIRIRKNLLLTEDMESEQTRNRRCATGENRISGSERIVQRCGRQTVLRI